MIKDFEDFKEEELKAAFRNMRTSIPGLQAVPEQLNAAGDVIAPAMPAVPGILPCLVSARCALRLNVASNAFHYYASIERETTPTNMNYNGILKVFHVEWECLQKLSEETNPTVPILTRQTSPLKWIESFRDCLYRTFGVRHTPLSYVIRTDVNSPTEVEDPLATVCRGATNFTLPYGSSGSIYEELIARLTHAGPLFQTDNALVYSMLEVAT